MVLKKYDINVEVLYEDRFHKYISCTEQTLPSPNPTQLELHFRAVVSEHISQGICIFCKTNKNNNSFETQGKQHKIKQTNMTLSKTEPG